MSPFHTFIQIPKIIKETICSYELFTLHLNTCRINTFKHHSVCYLPFRTVGNNIYHVLPTFGYLKDHIITREGNKKHHDKCYRFNRAMSYSAHIENRYCLRNRNSMYPNYAIIYGKKYIISYDSTQNIYTWVIYSPDLYR